MSRHTIWLACLALTGAGCAETGGTPSGDTTDGSEWVAELESPAPSRATAGEADDGPHALRVNRTLIYPVQWGRAEDMAETLRPVFEARYGSGVRIVAHPQTNHLLITLPPRSSREVTPVPPSSGPTTPRR